MRSDPLPSFANYTIERELGAGGMAVVYLAHDLRHDRDVAIKVLHPELGAAIGGERFLAEIKTTARLQHPHILPLLDSGHADGLYYYVMPYVAGETLRSRLDREGQLPMDDAIRIAREIADALGAAHALGIIHRDVKPENILLQGGHALVADFGIALAVQHAGGARMTQTGLSLGTPQYMSPEQAMGEKQIDLRTDIYALGAVTYEMLAGEPPFTGASVQAIIAKAMTERPTPLRTVRDTVPPGVEAAILKSLAKLPADRFSSASAFSDALVNGMQAGAPTVAPESHVVKQAPRANRIWQIVAGLALAVAAVALMIPRGAPSVRSVLVQRRITYEGNVIGAAISPDGLWLAYVQDDCALVDREACSATMQVREVDGVQSVHIATWHWIDPDLHWSGDGKSVVFKGSEKGSAENVFVVDRLGGTPRQMHVSPTAMTVMPDGHTLAMTVGAESAQWIQRWDLNTLALVDSARLPPQLGITSLSASPVDGTLAAIGRFNGAPKILLLDSHARLLDSLFAGTRQVVRWDSTGTAVLVFDDGESGSTADDLLRVGVGKHRFDRSAPPVTVLGQVTTGAQGRFDVSRTGRLALVSQPVLGDLMVGALGAVPGAWRSLRQGSQSIWGAAFTLDGKAILAGSSDNLAENLYEFPLLPGRPRALTAYRGTATTGGRWAQDADVSPDGAHIAFTRGSANSIDFVFIDSSGGRDRRIATGSTAGLFLAPRWLTNDIVVIKRNGAFVSVDTTGAGRDSVIIPDSIGHRDGAWMNRAEQSMYFMTNRGSIAAADFRTHQVRSAARADFALVVVGWLPNGTLLVSDATLEGTGIAYKSLKTSVFRVESDGKLTLISRVARHCLNVTIDRAGTTLACTVVSVGGDVQLAVATSR